MKLLQQFLPSIVQYSPEADIYVADNASTDTSISFVSAHFPNVKIIKNDHNLGFAGGYNQALLNIDAEIYALVNSDIEVTENWLEPILQTFEKESETAIIQPKILDYKNKEYFEYAGAAGGFLDQYGYAYCRGRIFQTLEKDSKQYEDNCQIAWASGACFFIRSSVYQELKGFDADFFAHQEEIDLCWRGEVEHSGEGDRRRRTGLEQQTAVRGAGNREQAQRRPGDSARVHRVEGSGRAVHQRERNPDPHLPAIPAARRRADRDREGTGCHPAASIGRRASHPSGAEREHAA